MKQTGVRILAGLLTAVFTFTGINIEASAGTGVSSVLPAGGINLSMLSDTSLASIQSGNKATKKVESNIEKAYLDNSVVAAAAKEQVQEEDAFKDLVIAQVNKYVNVRSIPNEEGEIVGKLYDKSVGTFLSEVDGWYEITSGNVTGYVKGEYCVTGEAAVALAKEVGNRIATVTTTTLRVRVEPSTEAAILDLIPIGEELLVLEETDLWAKVNIEEGDGWISKEFVEIQTEFVHAESKAEEEARLAKEDAARKEAQKAAAAKSAAKSNSSSSTTSTSTSDTPQPSVTIGEGSELGVSVAEYAVQFVGNPYKWGGTSLTDGADCSGFVMSVYENFGVSLPHSSAADRKQGAAVDGLDAAQPGDLICYSGHVALYIGEGKIVHASTKKTGIIISKADYKKVLAVRRIF